MLLNQCQDVLGKELLMCTTDKSQSAIKNKAVQAAIQVHLNTNPTATNAVAVDNC